MRFAVVIFLLYAAHLPLYAGTFDREKEMFNAFSSGDEIRLLNETMTFIRSDPGSVRSFLFLKDVANLTAITGYTGEIKELLSSMLAGEGATPIARCGQRRAAEILSVNERRARGGDALYFQKRFKPVMEWTISDIFFKYGRGDLLYRFPGETDISRDGGKRKVSCDYMGIVNLRKTAGDRKGIVYLNTFLSFDREARFRIESQGEYILFIGGRKICENIRGVKFRYSRLFETNGKGNVRITMKSFIDNEGIRVFVEDMEGRPVNPRYADKGKMIDDETYAVERDDYPYLEAVSMPNVIERNFYTGWVLSDSESDEALALFKEAARQYDNPVIWYFYAIELLAAGKRGDNSSHLVEGWRLVDMMTNRFPSFVPALDARLKWHIDNSAPESIAAFIRKTEKKSVRSYAYNMHVLGFYNERMGDLFLKRAEQLCAIYPRATEAQTMLADYCAKKYPERSVKICREILTHEQNYHASELYARLLGWAGVYEKNTGFDEWYNDDVNAVIRQAEYLIAINKLTDAKKLLITHLPKYDDVRFYELLGKIELLCGRDPELFWEKGRSVYPEGRFPGDYLRYVKGQDCSFLYEYLDRSVTQKQIDRFIGGEPFHTSVIIRRYVHSINHNATGRMLCEELLYIRNDEDISKYGEYKIPFAGDIVLIEARTYSRNGRNISSPRMHEINGERYLSIEGISKDCLVHIVYEADNSLTVLAGSTFIETGERFIQSYEEPVLFSEVVATYPETMNIQIHHSSVFTEKREKGENGYTVRLTASDIPSKSEEPDMPDGRNILAWYAISSYINADDYASWFRGFLIGKKTTSQSFPDINGDVDAIVSSVYKDVMENITPDDDPYYRIRSVDDVLYSGNGNETERTVVAMAMLEKKGIKAYPALVRRRERNTGNSRFEAWTYSSVLLFVPSADEGKGMWIDFYDRYVPCGTIRTGLEKGEAVVVTDDSALFRRVYSTVQTHEKALMDIELKNGEGIFHLEIEYGGKRASVSRYFADQEDGRNAAVTIADNYSKRSDLTGFSTISGKDGFIFKMDGIIEGGYHETSKTIVIAPFIRTNELSLFLSGSTRTNPLYIREGAVISEEYRFTLPEGINNEEYNFSRAETFEGITVSYSIERKKNTSVIIAKRKVVYSECEIGEEKYGDFSAFVNECGAIDTMKIVLRKSK
jgi:hypothetical protein